MKIIEKVSIKSFKFSKEKKTLSSKWLEKAATNRAGFIT